MNTRPLHIASWCLALIVAASAPTTFAEPPGGIGPGGMRGPGGGGRGPGGDRGWSDWTSEQKEQFVKELREFCTEHSPRRWQDIESRMQQGGGLGNMDHMARRFRELQMLEKFDPELHKIKVSQLEVEDREYFLLCAIKDTPATDTQRIADLKSKLADQSKEYVSLRLKERSHRVNWLNKELEREKKKLADDEEAMARFIEMRVAELEKQGPNFFFRERGRRGGPTTAPTAPPAQQPTPPK